MNTGDTATHDGSDGWMRAGGRIAALLITFFVFEWWFLRAGRLAEHSYAAPSILLETLTGLFSFRNGPVVGLGVLALLAGFAGVCVRHFRSLWVSWHEFSPIRGIRVVVGGIALILAWAYGTYDYNLYYDQAHLLDRGLLLALALLVIWRPVFVFPFTLLVIAVVWQFSYPIAGYSVAEQFALVRMLVVFAGALALRAVTGRTFAAEFIFLAIVILASSYLKCGLGKAALGRPDHPYFNWISHGHIYYLMFATHANGWLGFLDTDALTTLATRIGRFDLPMVIATMVLECGALFVLWGRRTSLFFLAGWSAFHLGVLMVSGIFFWKWILVDTMLLAVVFTAKSRSALPIFTRAHFVFSVPLILGGLTWFDPVNLAWYDSPVNYTYRFVGVGESGERYSLSPRAFAPYDYQFTLASFHYLSPDPGLPVAFGAIWDRDAADELLKSRSLDDVESIERARGRTMFSEDRAATFDAFVTRFFGAYNARTSKRTPLTPIQSPPQLVTFTGDDAYRGQERLVEVRVSQVTSFYNGERYDIVRTRELRHIPIPTGAS